MYVPMVLMDPLEAAKLFKHAATYPNKGDKIMAEIIDFEEDDGVRKYTIKFDNSLGNQTRIVFLLEELEAFEEQE